ncbi:hypothetical protein EROM_081010 [Encephalitozoon romaleae SJ-2008]|uniref:Inner centromere protein ARK-binding domain-containing protein n=1 Tax=Encephalitozoon romaleae (strain SJ-2008) TaxID=1178016 RepID=I6ZUV5_ENCRO|nr:hypothetical protein EROM_081010 [Encephalitozoon romaleae SJ-2008]AFN83516.1 hypothetical protein EROM_081010 [Encephalitozoon romaleae SJ-2008]
MELLKEFLEEWRSAVGRVKDRVICEQIGIRDECSAVVSEKAGACPKEVSGEVDKENDERFPCDGDFEGSVFDHESLIPGHIPIIKNRDEKDLSMQEERRDVVGPQAMSSCMDMSRENNSNCKELIAKEETNGVDLYSSESCKGVKLSKPSVIRDLAINPPKRRDVLEPSARDAKSEKEVGKVQLGVMSKDKDGKNLSKNVKLNEALIQLKKRYLDRVNESVCGKAEKGMRIEEMSKPGVAGSHKVGSPPFNANGQESEAMKRFDGSNLYKQAIDHQLLKSAGRVPQDVYKPKTKIPRVDEDDIILDPDFIVPDFAKDPAINFKVKMQDHRALEKYFSNGHEIDVERLFPHVRNVSNNSPNKWPSKRSGG